MDCLVTKLKGVVNDDTLLRLGEFRIKVSQVSSPSSKTQGFTFGFDEDSTLEIIGDGYFTDRALSANLGKTLTISKDVPTDVYVKNGNFELAVLNKYALTQIAFYAQQDGYANASQLSNRSINLNDISYSTHLTKLNLAGVPMSGTLSDLSKLINLIDLSMGGTAITGDIASLKNLTKLTNLGINNTNIYGDIASLSLMKGLSSVNFDLTQVSGNISAISSLTLLRTIYLSSTQVSGNISALSGLTSLSTLSIQNSQVVGDLSSLSNLTELYDVNLSNLTITGNVSSLQNLAKLSTFSSTSSEIEGNLSSFIGLSNLREITIAGSKVVGDLAIMPRNCHYIGFGGSYSGTGVTWSSRESPSKILGINGYAPLDNVDKMLIDQSNCDVYASIPEGSYLKTISVIGTRTSASDSAVAKLRELGYSINIKNSI